ncbi:hypothetical protein PENTCL1PPCAC_16599, partial [Pristionchus entomophagus]
LRLLHSNSSKMSTGTQRMHTRFGFQLSIQASIPFIGLVFPLLSILILTLSTFRFQSNSPGYMLHSLLMLHGPLTAQLTLALYDPYRKVISRITLVCPSGHIPL